MIFLTHPSGIIVLLPSDPGWMGVTMNGKTKLRNTCLARACVSERKSAQMKPPFLFLQHKIVSYYLFLQTALPIEENDWMHFSPFGASARLDQVFRGNDRLPNSPRVIFCHISSSFSSLKYLLVVWVSRRHICISWEEIPRLVGSLSDILRPKKRFTRHLP